MNQQTTIRTGLLGILMMLLTLSAFAQERMVTGTVTNNQGEALIGVSVLVQGTTKGTITDLDGKYKVKLQENESFLVFSYLGFDSQVIEVGNKTAINLVMEEDAHQLGEVVVTALGIERDKKAIGYAMQEVNGDQLSAVVQTSPLNALSGKVAGLNVSTSGSGPTGSTNVTIRGSNSLTGNNQPLYVIDGVPISNDGGTSAGQYGGFDYGNAANNIDPNDIASISVLKGGAASALYGSRGQNGVIMITTKKGSKKQGISVAVNSNFVMEKPAILPSFQNSYSQGAGGKFITTSNLSWGAKMTGAETVTNFLGEEQVLSENSENPIGDFFKDGYTWTNSISISKNSDIGTVYFSASKQDNESIMPNSNFDKLSMNLRAITKLTDFFTVDAKVNFINQKAFNRPNLAGSPDNPMYSIMQLPRSITLDQMSDYITVNGYPVHYTNKYQHIDGKLTVNGDAPAFAASPLSQNPYWATELNLNNDERNRAIAFVEGDLNLKSLFGGSSLDALSLKFRAGADYYVDNRQKHTHHNTLYKGNGLATINTSDATRGEYNYDIILNGMKTLGQFGISLTGGASMNRIEWTSTAANSESGIINPFGAYVVNNFNNRQISKGQSQREIQSVFGMMTLDWNDQLFLDLTGRNDWSSTMNPDNWSFFYPSASFSWVASETFGLGDAVNYLKFRTSYAWVGNSLPPNQLYFNYTTNPDQYFDLPYGAIPGSKPNYDMLPEMTKSFDVGVEAQLLNDRISVDLAYYQTGTENQLFQAPLSPSSGFQTGWVNAGFIRNDGIELALTGKPVHNENIEWELMANISHNRSMVKELTEDVEKLNLGGYGGVLIQAIPGSPVGTIHGTKFAKDDAGNMILDGNNLPMIATTEEGNRDDQAYLGNSVPQWLSGFGSNFRYKSFFVNVFIDGKFGHKMFSYTNLRGAQVGTLDFTVEGRDAWAASEADRVSLNVSADAWEPTGGYKITGVDQEGNTVSSFVDPQKYWDRVSQISEAFVYDASFVRLQQVAIGFNLPKSVLDKVYLKKASLSLVGNNLAFLYNNVPNVSPESAVTTNNSGGVEMFAFPQTASYGFNLNIEL
ncbi:SusC/RagA family TonB-linked outer membrane protein [Limibacter armeniacum]|uniref:SusC/RagA family TonB-linked outer membrane protein n=1 Tax=Limibacter armeniacum TaxID=466084 RepID=UPI002FE5DECE